MEGDDDVKDGIAEHGRGPGDLGLRSDGGEGEREAVGGVGLGAAVSGLPGVAGAAG